MHDSNTSSDRERFGLHGPVKSVVEEYSTTEFDREGKTVAWTGNTWHGRVQRTYSYDDAGRLTRISGSNGDHVDEFRYDAGGRKTQIRRVPARPQYKNRAFGLGAMFDATVEGDVLVEGGTVETVFGEHDKPMEAKVLDDENTVLCRVTYVYNEDGRLSLERLTTENLPLPKEISVQIPPEHRQAALEQLKKQFAEISQRSGIGADAQLTYVYDEGGHLLERHMRQGPIHEDIVLQYNERGDICELSRTAGGFPHPTGEISEPALHSWREYEYDSLGNWISETDASKVNGNETKHTRGRQIVYFD